MLLAFFKRRRERARQAEADADELMLWFGTEAYYEARSRTLEARRRAVVDGNRADDH